MSEHAMQTLADGLLLDISNGCATLTLNRPERHNSLSQEDMLALRDALMELDKDQSLRVLVLTGAGEKTFCSGAFLNEVADRSFKGNPFEDLTDALENFRLPTICAFNGSVYGGGGEVSLCCDFRIGVEGMRMFVPPSRLGIHYPEKGLMRMITRVGLSAAKRIILAVETFDAQAMLQMGFIDYLVPRDQLADRTRQLAQDLAALAPLSVQTMKRSLNELARGEANSETIKARIAQCWNSQDHKEAVSAMAEKRKPVFQQK